MVIQFHWWWNSDLQKKSDLMLRHSTVTTWPWTKLSRSVDRQSLRSVTWQKNYPRKIRLPILSGWLAASINFLHCLVMGHVKVSPQNSAGHQALCDRTAGVNNRNKLHLAGVESSEIRLFKTFNKISKKEASLVRKPPSGWGPPFRFATLDKNPWRRPCVLHEYISW